MERGRLVWRLGLGRLLLFDGGASAKDHESLAEEEEVILLIRSGEVCLGRGLSLLSRTEAGPKTKTETETD